MAKNVAKRKSGGGVGGVTPAERTESTRYGRGQGKTKRGSKMKGANAKGSATRDGQIIGKQAFAAARDAAGESWKTMSKADKAAAVLKKVPAALTATEAQGVLRALGIRILPLGGDSTAALEKLTAWGAERGVQNPASEMEGAVTSRASGESPKQVARKKGSGIKGEAPKGKTARRVKKRSKRLGKIAERAAADAAERGKSIAEKEPRVSGDKAEAPSAAPLPKGVKYKEITYTVTEKRKVSKPEYPNTEFEAEDAKIEKEKKTVVPMKGNKVYVDDGKGGWRTVTVDEYKSMLADTTGSAEKKGKPSPTKTEAPQKMTGLSASGAAFNKEYVGEAAAQGFYETNRKVYEGNKIRMRDGLPPLERYTAPQYVDEAFPNLSREERSQLVNAIRAAAREARRAGKPLAGDQKNSQTKSEPKKGKRKKITVLRPQTVEEGRAAATAKERRAAAGRAAPLEPVTVEGRKAKRARKERVKSVGSVLSAVMGSGDVVAPETVAGAPKRAKRKFTPKTPGTELEKQMSEIRKSMEPAERRTLDRIAKASRSGFTKPQVKQMIKAGVLGKVSSKVKSAAKLGGYSSMVIAALNFLQEDINKKRN